jgi:hypothetical protein
MAYANAGTVCHKILQYFYEELKDFNKLDILKERFDMLWKKYTLQESVVKDKVNDYWKMVLEGINLRIDFTSCELKIYYDDYLGYLDIVNTNTHTVYDWKTSTVSEANKEEYLQQMKVYAMLYYRKFHIIPTACTVIYLKKINSPLIYHPTIEDIQSVEREVQKVQDDIEQAIK